MAQSRTASDLIHARVSQSIQVKTRFFADNAERLAQAAEIIAHGFQNGKKLLLFGNGGSAADAQHIAAELIGRCVAERDRQPFPAISLVTDTSALTAIANDYGFDNIFARQVLALANPGDTAIAISTSGNSPNVLKGIEAARKKDMYTIGLTGADGGHMRDAVEVLFCVPSRYTPDVQETHIMVGHILCELIDRLLMPDKVAGE
jgi:D-sedoheptulose 7-phosphate isomerase